MTFTCTTWISYCIIDTTLTNVYYNHTYYVYANGNLLESLVFLNRSILSNLKNLVMVDSQYLEPVKKTILQFIDLSDMLIRDIWVLHSNKSCFSDLQCAFLGFVFGCLAQFKSFEMLPNNFFLNFYENLYFLQHERIICKFFTQESFSNFFNLQTTKDLHQLIQRVEKLNFIRMDCITSSKEYPLCEDFGTEYFAQYNKKFNVTEQIQPAICDIQQISSEFLKNINQIEIPCFDPHPSWISYIALTCGVAIASTAIFVIFGTFIKV